MSSQTPQRPGGPEDTPQRTSTTSNGQSQSSPKSEQVRERAREVQERLEEGYHELEQRYDDVRGQLQQVNDRSVEFIRENPAICIAGAIGVGFVIGRLASRRWLT